MPRFKSGASDDLKSGGHFRVQCSSPPLRSPSGAQKCTLTTDASSLRRRLVIRTLLPSFLAACLAFTPLAAQEAQWRHGAALLGEPKYSAGFKQFDYVNPNAPKGGLVRLGAQGTFDSFNLVTAGVKGTPALGLTLVYESLTTPSLDEPSASYGLLAESFTYPDDYSSVTFRLRPEARWHDGQPVTAEDVIFSFEVLKANSPFHAYYYANVEKAEKTGEREVRF